MHVKGRPIAGFAVDPGRSLPAVEVLPVDPLQAQGGLALIGRRLQSAVRGSELLGPPAPGRERVSGPEPSRTCAPLHARSLSHGGLSPMMCSFAAAQVGLWHAQAGLGGWIVPGEGLT